jgi:hypothetical protein
MKLIGDGIAYGQYPGPATVMLNGHGLAQRSMVQCREDGINRSMSRFADQLNRQDLFGARQLWE